MAAEKPKQPGFHKKKGRQNAGPPRIQCVDFFVPVEKCESSYSTHKACSITAQTEGGGTSKHPAGEDRAGRLSFPLSAAPPLLLRESTRRRGFPKSANLSKSARTVFAANDRDIMEAEAGFDNQPQKLNHMDHRNYHLFPTKA